MKLRPARRISLSLPECPDLSAIKQYVWKGDKVWAARQAGVSPSLLTNYLAGRQRPTTARTRLACRLLLKRIDENKAYEAEHPGERPQRIYRRMKHLQLRHAHNLPAINKYVWPGDKAWAARQAGIQPHLMKSYLEGRLSPVQAKSRLAWRLLLAKVSNNKAFEAAWWQAVPKQPKVSELKAAWKDLHLGDRCFMARLLGVNKKRVSYLARLKSKQSVLPKRSKHIHEKYVKIAAAVVLKAQYNRRLREQVAPWLKEREYGSAQA